MSIAVTVPLFSVVPIVHNVNSHYCFSVQCCLVWFTMSLASTVSVFTVVPMVHYVNSRYCSSV